MDNPNDSIRKEIAYCLRYYKNAEQLFKNFIIITNHYKYDEQEAVRETLVKSLGFYNKETHINDLELRDHVYYLLKMLAEDKDEIVIAAALDKLSLFINKCAAIDPEYLVLEWERILEIAYNSSLISYDLCRQNSALLVKRLINSNDWEEQLQALAILDKLSNDETESVRYECLKSTIQFYKYGIKDLKPTALKIIEPLKTDPSKRIYELADVSI